MAAADGPARRLVAHDEAVAMAGAEGAVEAELGEAAPAGGQLPTFEQGDAPGGLGGREVDVHGRPVRQRPLLGRQHAKARIEPAHRARAPGATIQSPRAAVVRVTP